jgi:methylase of polypeptide subunit release factors
LPPLHLGPPEHFAAVRALLEGAGFTEAELCRRYGIQKLAQFELEADKNRSDPQAEDPAGVLLRLFVDTRFVSGAEIENALGHEALNILLSLGLIQTKPEDPSVYSSPIALYPTQGLYIVSDRWHNPDRSPMFAQDDVVYPAIVANAQQFLEHIPRERCHRFLEVCCGTGVAALLAAQEFAAQAYGFDIAPRSVHFADFNRRLNGIENATMVTGDLYEPAGDLTFDRIAAHPPYVPVLRPKWIYHDGGQDGEGIVRRVISELPRYLAPGGLFYMRAMGTDRTSAPYEYRIREWLGPHHAEFDVALIPVRSVEPEEFATRSSLKSASAAHDTAEFKKLFHQLGISRMVIGTVLIQRKTGSRPAFTVRRQASTQTRWAEMRWMLDWESRAASPDAAAMILNSRLKAAPGAELKVSHRLEDGQWSVSEHLLQIERPFSMETRTDPWVPYLLSLCDGTKTGAEYLNELKQQEVLAADTPAHEFAQALAVYVSGGFLRLENQ